MKPSDIGIFIFMATIIYLGIHVDLMTINHNITDLNNTMIDLMGTLEIK
jgi:hypothetical protein